MQYLACLLLLLFAFSLPAAEGKRTTQAASPTDYRAMSSDEDLILTPFILSMKAGYSYLSGLGGVEAKAHKVAFAAGTWRNPDDELTLTLSMAYYLFPDGHTSFVSAAYTPNAFHEELCANSGVLGAFSSCAEVVEESRDVFSFLVGYRWEWPKANLQLGAGMRKGIDSNKWATPWPVAELSVGYPLFFRPGPDLPRFR